jgi:hypothetical protein
MVGFIAEVAKKHNLLVGTLSATWATATSTRPS